LQVSPTRKAGTGKLATTGHEVTTRYVLHQTQCRVTTADTVWVFVESCQSANKFVLYPNPNNGIFTLEWILNPNLDLSGGARFLLYSVEGKRVGKFELPITEKKKNFELPHLASGLYEWQVEGEEKLFTQGSWLWVSDEL
jgi:hypothetical protein